MNLKFGQLQPINASYKVLIRTYGKYWRILEITYSALFLLGKPGAYIESRDHICKLWIPIEDIIEEEECPFCSFDPIGIEDLCDEHRAEEYSS